MYHKFNVTGIFFLHSVNFRKFGKTKHSLHNTFEILLEHQTDANPTLNN
jgi:hypothetical protein